MSEELSDLNPRSVQSNSRSAAGFSPRQILKAVDGISIDIPKGSFFGVVGESGSGKTTLGRALLKAVPIAHGADASYDDGEVQL